MRSLYSKVTIMVCLSMCTILSLSYAVDVKLLHQPLLGETAPGDNFGTSVAVYDQRVLVGAPRHSNDNGSTAGSVYVFDLASGDMVRELVAVDGRPADFFGNAIAVDGNLAVIGAKFHDHNTAATSGAAYVFNLDNNSSGMKLVPVDVAPGDKLGYSVAIHGDKAIVGAIDDDDRAADSGSAYVFNAIRGNQIIKLSPTNGAPNDEFGVSVDIHNDLAIVGAFVAEGRTTGTGAAYIFDITTSNMTKLIASDGDRYDGFGSSVAINDEYAVVGARTRNEGGHYESGAVYVYELSNPGAYKHKFISDILSPSQAKFGASVEIMGDILIVGAEHITGAWGYVYFFDLHTGTQLLRIGDGNGTYGGSVFAHDNTIVVGARTATINGFYDGTAYIYKYDCSAKSDYNGDGYDDLALYRQDKGWWHIRYNNGDGTFGSEEFLDLGNSEMTPVPADYNGDCITDPAVYDPGSGNWYVYDLQAGVLWTQQWGNSLMDPVPGDYNGDGKAEYATFEPSSGIWRILDSDGTTRTLQNGNNTVTLLPGKDFDGDGYDDPAVYLPSQGLWSVDSGRTGSRIMMVNWGRETDIPAPADYDGDGSVDRCIFRPSAGEWHTWLSDSQVAAVWSPWGSTIHTPTPGYYNATTAAQPGVYGLDDQGAGWFSLKDFMSSDYYHFEPFGWSPTIPADVYYHYY